MSEAKEIFTMQEVAEHLKVSKRTLDRLIKNKKIIAFKAGGQWRFETNDINNFIKNAKKETESSLP